MNSSTEKKLECTRSCCYCSEEARDVGFCERNANRKFVTEYNKAIEEKLKGDATLYNELRMRFLGK